jgi:hypothetical protein
MDAYYDYSSTDTLISPPSNIISTSRIHMWSTSFSWYCSLGGISHGPASSP